REVADLDAVRLILPRHLELGEQEQAVAVHLTGIDVAHGPGALGFPLLARCDKPGGRSVSQRRLSALLANRSLIAGRQLPNCPETDQSSRDIFSRRSCACWASTVIVAIGRAIRRLMPIGSPVTSHQPYSP